MSSFATRTEIRATRSPFLCDKIAVTMAQITTTDGVRSVALVEPLTLKKIDGNEAMCEPVATFWLRPDEAQQFMDELWRAGIRPTEGAGSVGQLGAVKDHLDDLRALVFKLDPVTMKRQTTSALD